MNYCPYCGNKLKENDKFCGKCGRKLVKDNKEDKNNDIIVPKETNNVQLNELEIPKKEQETIKKESKPTNTYANIGFILSLISIACCGLTAPIALIISIIGILESKNKDNAGFEISLAGTIISSVLILITMIIFSIGKIIIGNI